jgi:hypothetical protein
MKCEDCIWIREGIPIKIAFFPGDVHTFSNIYCEALPRTENIDKDRKGCIYYTDRSLND